jgi:hypothetical protein
VAALAYPRKLELSTPRWSLGCPGYTGDLFCTVAGGGPRVERERHTQHFHRDQRRTRLAKAAHEIRCTFAKSRGTTSQSPSDVTCEVPFEVVGLVTDHTRLFRAFLMIISTRVQTPGGPDLQGVGVGCEGMIGVVGAVFHSVIDPRVSQRGAKSYSQSWRALVLLRGHIGDCLRGRPAHE